MLEIKYHSSPFPDDAYNEQCVLLISSCVLRVFVFLQIHELGTFRSSSLKDPENNYKCTLFLTADKPVDVNDAL